MEERVKNVLSEILGFTGLDMVQIRPESNLINDLDADSLDHIEIMMGLEEEFDVEIPDEDEDFKTVGDIHKYLKAKGKQ